MIGFRASTAIVALTMVFIIGTAAAPASATAGSGWVPTPSQPSDRAAGVLCDFAVHTDPIVDEVMKKTLSTNLDGSPLRELYVGRLIIRVTNVESGAHYDADASGDAIFVYSADGTVTWYAVGPTLVGFREGAGNLPRGFYVLDGVYRLVFAPDGHKTLTTLHGTQDDVCQRLD